MIRSRLGPAAWGRTMQTIEKGKVHTHWLWHYQPRKVFIGLLTKQQPPTQKSIILHATIQTNLVKCNLLKYN